ncbi:MAG TPA: hypothetical protein VGO90_10930 [Chthoniobacteraceae bacterium]|nr:hypothetical protein [Chthoniobacteraceae bacterium]
MNLLQNLQNSGNPSRSELGAEVQTLRKRITLCQRACSRTAHPSAAHKQDASAADVVNAEKFAVAVELLLRTSEEQDRMRIDLRLSRGTFEPAAMTQRYAQLQAGGEERHNDRDLRQPLQQFGMRLCIQHEQSEPSAPSTAPAAR